MCSFVVLGRVELITEIFSGVNHPERVSLGDEALESPFVEDVNKPLLLYHLVELAEEGLAVVGGHLLNAHALTQRILRLAGLADLGDAHIAVHYHLHLLLAQFMTVDGQRRRLLSCHNGHRLRVAEDVAVHQ